MVGSTDILYYFYASSSLPFCHFRTSIMLFCHMYNGVVGLFYDYLKKHIIKSCFNKSNLVGSLIKAPFICVRLFCGN